MFPTQTVSSDISPPSRETQFRDPFPASERVAGRIELAEHRIPSSRGRIVPMMDDPISPDHHSIQDDERMATSKGKMEGKKRAKRGRLYWVASPGEDHVDPSSASLLGKLVDVLRPLVFVVHMQLKPV